MSYLIHFNKNHSPKNGQFISGDGDADGVRDDHHNYSKNKVTSPKNGSVKYTKDGRKIGKKLNTFDYIKTDRMEKSRQKFSREFSETESGKKAIKKSEKADKEFQKKDAKADPYDYYFGTKEQKQKYKSAMKERDNAFDNYSKTKREEMYERGEYIARSMIKKYGEKAVANFSFFDHDDPLNVRKTEIIYKDAEDLVKQYAEIYSKDFL